jgi:hypothetical protein
LLLGGILTQGLSWRWTLFINPLLASPTAASRAILLLPGSPVTTRPHLEIPGTLAASSGLGTLVYGLSHAETSGWISSVTVACLAGSVLLLAVFVAIERRSPNPLVPLRVLTDRDRSGAYLAVLLVGSGLFGVFLLLTFYLERRLGYSAVQTGLAFLPLVAVDVVPTGAE